MKWLNDDRIRLALSGFVVTVVLANARSANAGVVNQAPIADAGASRYAAQDPVMLDGTGSYDPDGSGPLSYSWQQVSGPLVTITDAESATPTISGFVQTDEIQECEFGLLVGDGEQSVGDTVKVFVVPDFGENEPNMLYQLNPPFDPNRPTLVGFSGLRGCWESGPWIYWSTIDWFREVNFMTAQAFDNSLYRHFGDMLIVYLCANAPEYKQPIQTFGHSSGGPPAIDIAIYLNEIYADRRYAVNRVTALDTAGYCRDWSESIQRFLASAVDGEQCWVDNYSSTLTGAYGLKMDQGFQANTLNVWFDRARVSSLWTYQQNHQLCHKWYRASLTDADMGKFNGGVVAGAYWSVVGPGKNLQLASTPGVETYKFTWYGDDQSGYMDFYDEQKHPGRLPEPVTLVGPMGVKDPKGILLSCEESENAVGYELLLGPDPYRVVDYDIISDTPAPPIEIITTFPFEETWCTIRARDQYGSTIYADPVRIDSLSLPVENISTGITYQGIQLAVDDAGSGDELVVEQGHYLETIEFKGKNLTVRSIDPDDPAVIAATIIDGNNLGSVLTFSGGEDASCVLAGFTITGGEAGNGGGICCANNSSPSLANCTVTNNAANQNGGGIYCGDSSSPSIANCSIVDNTATQNGGGVCTVSSDPTVLNCTITGNSASLVGGGMYCAGNSNSAVMNCTLSGNSASFRGGGIFCTGASATLSNCILWGDAPGEVFNLGGTLTINYSDLQGGFAGEGNIDLDPLFVDPDLADYHLSIRTLRTII